MGGPITFFILVAFLIIGSTLEFLSMPDEYRPLKGLNIFLVTSAFALIGLAILDLIDAKWLSAIALLLPILFLVELYRKHNKALEHIALSVFSWLYLGVPFVLLFAAGFVSGTYDYSFILGFFILTWLYDTFAYLIGIAIGQRRLFERISPKKSWEGFIGGATVALLCAYFVSLIFPVLSHQQWAVVSLIASLGGTLGDLTESRIKRQFEVKDSGKILPGHGGLLDRFDSILVSVPIYFVYLHIVF